MFIAYSLHRGILRCMGDEHAVRVSSHTQIAERYVFEIGWGAQG
jgi:hypothetical protein